jgi:hypothetical protein
MEHKFENFAPFMYVLTEKLTPKERHTLVEKTGISKADTEHWQKLPQRAKKLETALKAAGLRKPSQVYMAAVKAPGEEVYFLLYHSALKPVQDRLRNYLQKYLPAALEVSDVEVDGGGATPGTPKFQKAKEELIAKRLNSRPKPQPVEPPASEEPPSPPQGMRRGRPPGSGAHRPPA